MNAEILKSIQILALDAVENPDYDAFIRKVQRWYSKEFSTPLIQVETIDLIHVLQAYYEEKFGEAYQPDDTHSMEVFERIKHSICFPEEIQQVEKEDEEWAKEMVNRIETENAKTVSIPDNNNEAPTPNTIQEALDQGEEIVMSGEDLSLEY